MIFSSKTEILNFESLEFAVFGKFMVENDSIFERKQRVNQL